MSKQIKVRLVEKKDLNQVFLIISRCAEKLHQRGLDDWVEYYTLDRVSAKIEDKVLSLVFSNGEAVACLALNKEMLYYYTDVDKRQFKDPQASAWYLSTLAIDPSFQGQGFGSKILGYIEHQAKELGVKYIRSDCNATDPLLIDFYTKNGYTLVGLMKDEPNYMLIEKEI